jgi:NAD(P)-dependent dehydrogenase (short-subunit alcohol dehydrogenase family)
VKTILVIGGYGGFGGRLSRRLSRSGYQVLVGGRSLRKAKAFCDGLLHCRPIRLDRHGDVSAVLLAERPDIIVDAAGPFQGSDYRVIEACIGARIAYIDIADARDFVTGIGRFDDRAKMTNIPIISGASSVPALSHAVVAELAAGLDQVSAIEIAISASSRASAGPSVSKAILGGVGQELQHWGGRRWQVNYGWQSIRSQRFDLLPGKSLGRRKVALSDVPDLWLLPQRYPGISLVSFRAGTESDLANLTVWLASWPVRWGWLGSLASLAGLLLPAQRLTALWGSDRSGMTVSLFGTSGARRLERRWTLIAEEGDGPEIPIMAAALLVDRIARGRVSAGARDAGEELSLFEFQPLFEGLSIHHGIADIDQPPPLYAGVMGADFARLAPALRSIHGVLRDGGATGRAVVSRGRHPIARLVAKIMRFPPAGEHGLHVHFSENAGVERWTRDFGGSRFSSSLSANGSELVERFGPLRFTFSLSAEDGGLMMAMTKWSLGPIPLPKWLAPHSPAREWEADGLFHFDVPINLPLVGRVVHYRGWLDPAPMRPVKSQVREAAVS